MFPNARYASTYRGRQFGPGMGLEIIVRDDTSRLAVHQLSQTTAVPEGYGRPAVVLPRVSGAMSAKIAGAGQVTPDGMLALDAVAAIVGAGGIEALGGMIVSLAATIAGEGGVSSASLQAFLDLLATITGSGDLAGTRTGVGDMAAAVSGSGGAVSSSATGLGGMEATLRGYGDLTPEGIRDALWNALANQYTATGTMGAKLNTAGSGGVDISALVDALIAAMNATPPGVNVKQVNDLPIDGAGTAGDPWGPA